MKRFMFFVCKIAQTLSVCQLFFGKIVKYFAEKYRSSQISARMFMNCYEIIVNYFKISLFSSVFILLICRYLRKQIRKKSISVKKLDFFS